METDSVPLLVVDPGQDEEGGGGGEQPDFKKMVFFHGKELSGKSFVRMPQHNLVRIGIGAKGVYKMDSKTPKVLEHWEFGDIKDCSFSGYSFTLQLRSGGDYYIRTDDGEPICDYIDLFQKDPDKALEQARNNPPMSKVPESGVSTLRRKFSSEPQAPHNDFKFFTLNRRTARSNNRDPISKLTQQQNIEVDSRLRSERGYSIDTNKTRPHSLGSHELQKLEQSGGGGGGSPSSSGGRVNGDTEHKGTEKRQVARDVLVNKITEAAGKEKRLSNGIRVSPVSTKGEVTTTQSTTKVTPPTTAASTPPLTQSPKRPGTKGGGGGGGEQKGKDLAVDQQRRDTTTPVSDSSSDTIPLLRPGSSTSSGGPFSPTDEFQFMAGSEGESLIQQQQRGGGRGKSTKRDKSSSSEELYDKLEPYEQLSMSESSGSSRTTPAPVTPTPSNPGLTLTVAKDNGSCWSDESGEYDHLPPALEDSLPEKGQIRLDQLLGVSSYRRITSQPALSTPASARESPVDISPSNVIQEETSEEEEEDEDDELGDSFEAGKSPTNLDAGGGGSDEVKGQTEGGIVLRKRNRHLDPFADLLGSAHAAARLRWSQELNPLYDYIKGYKISESVKLYDSPSKLLKSANASDLHRKSAEGGELGGGGRAPAPSIIVEEESEPSSREQTCSPSESQGEGEGEGEGEEKCELEIPHETSTLPRARRPHLYEEISFADHNPEEERPASEMGMVEKLKLAAKKNRTLYEKDGQKGGALAHLIGRSDTSPIQHRKKMEKAGVSPRIGKRELLQQRRSRTINSLDDSATEKRKQKSMRAGDSLKDFSFVMREYRLFFVKLPNGLMCREIFNITKPICELREKLCDHIGADNPDHYQIYVEGACLTFLKEGEGGNIGDGKVNRAGSFTHIVDSQGLPDQGTEPFRLKSNLSFRMQGITTSRILSLIPDDEATDSGLALSTELISDPDEDFHKNWMSVVHGSVPCTLDDAVKLAALQYQSYFLDRTAVHSVVGFCRPTEFLPLEYSGIRGIEQKMYKEQEILKMKNHKDIKAAYNTHCSKLPTYETVFFPAREPRKKLLQSTKLKPIIIGVGSQGVLRVDPKTKEVLDTWSYSVLRNWAYSKRTFVLAFANKNYPVESNQAKWICQLIDFHVDMLAAQQHRQFLREEDRLSDVFPTA